MNEALGLAMKWSLKVVIWALLFRWFCAIVYDVAMPFLDFILSGNLENVFKAIDYFLPLPFILGCLTVLFMIYYTLYFFKFINWIYNMIFK